LIPDGVLVTVPEPVPVEATERLKLGIAIKVAVTLSAALIVTAQVPVPLHPAPLQPEKLDPAAAEAVSITCVPDWTLAVQIDPQSIPDGVLVTVPDPLPPRVTESVKGDHALI